ncbi:MAG: ACT domain-containing protein, partial [Planctomycetes bacterium]|nr:ACT domain-containing protein [Planctomycetota bacterium]
AFDVFEQEPPVEDHPLRSHPQVVCTPHLGASTTEAQEKVAFRIAEQMSAYLKEGIVRNAVNMPSVGAEVAERLKPWQKLAGTIGHMQAHLLDGGLTEVEVEVSGDLVELPQGAITSAVLEGLLGHLLNQSVNRVNAESVARDHGYTIKEVQGQDTDGYAGLLSVTLRSDSGEHIIQGAVFGERYPKVVRVDRWYLESDAKGDLLLVVNEDTPGRLAAITAVIADSGANVADLALGRDKATGTALNAIHLDGPLTEDALERVGAIDGVAWVRQLALTP